MPERKSKRTSAVIKRKLLEEKLEKRRVDAENRIQKARLKAIQRSEFVHEAARLRKINENIFCDNFLSETENSDQSPLNSSLEWDHSDETPPTFISCHSETSDADQIVRKVLEEIIELDESISLDLTDTKESNENLNARRNTSTDNNFLEAAVDTSPFNHLRWPPRLPSQEPEFNPLVHSSFSKDSEAPVQLGIVDEVVNEVFEEEHREADTEEQSKMEEQDYKNRLKVIKAESLKVQDGIQNFMPEAVTELHIKNFHERLKDIRDKLDVYCDVTAQLIVDLDGDNQEDEARIQHLKDKKERLRNEVLDNEKKVGDKVRTLIESQPLSKAEKEKDDNEKSIKVEKAKIDIEDVSEKVEELRIILSKIGKVKELNDEEIREKLIDSKRWENKLSTIKDAKTKLKKDLINLDFDEKNEKVESLEKEITNVTGFVRGKN